MQSHSETATAYTPGTPAAIIGADAMKALRAAGWIVVREDAIQRAQKDAYYEALENVRLGLKRAA
jgi:hypothetical protein